MMPFAGMDIGSTMTKVVITDEQEKILASHIGPTGAEHRHLALRVMDETIKKAGLSFDALDFVVATGYGRINVPFADRQITEITWGFTMPAKNVSVTGELLPQETYIFELEDGVQVADVDAQFHRARADDALAAFAIGERLLCLFTQLASD